MDLSEIRDLQLNLSENALERLDGEYVVISFSTGKYFSINQTGSDLISMVAQNLPTEDWESLLKEHYKEDNFSGIEEFLSKCEEEGILVAKAPNNIEVKRELPSDCARDKWSIPILNIFDDLSDLLLVDPIHESSTDGWPKQDY
jgi:hypothetical protein